MRRLDPVAWWWFGWESSRGLVFLRWSDFASPFPKVSLGVRRGRSWSAPRIGPGESATCQVAGQLRWGSLGFRGVAG